MQAHRGGGSFSSSWQEEDEDANTSVHRGCVPVRSRYRRAWSGQQILRWRWEEFKPIESLAQQDCFKVIMSKYHILSGIFHLYYLHACLVRLYIVSAYQLLTSTKTLQLTIKVPFVLSCLRHGHPLPAGGSAQSLSSILHCNGRKEKERENMETRERKEKGSGRNKEKLWREERGEGWGNMEVVTVLLHHELPC